MGERARGRERDGAFWHLNYISIASDTREEWRKERKKEGGREGGGTANHHLDVYFNFTVFGWHLKNSNLCACDMCSLNVAARKERAEKWYSCYLTSATNAGGIWFWKQFFKNHKLQEFSFAHCGLQIPHMRPDKRDTAIWQTWQQALKTDARKMTERRYLTPPVPCTTRLHRSDTAKKKTFLLRIKCCSTSVHVAQENNKSQGGKEWASIYSLIQKTLSPPLASYYPIASSPLILLTCHISVLVCGAWGVCTCICKCVCGCVCVWVHTCDTQPSITSLESFRSRCAPIHTHSQCFDFQKSKDVNHLPPPGECTHTDAHARTPAHARPRRTRTHTRMSYPSTSSSHSPPSLSRSPSSLPLSHSTIWE